MTADIFSGLARDSGAAAAVPALVGSAVAGPRWRRRRLAVDHGANLGGSGEAVAVACSDSDDGSRLAATPPLPQVLEDSYRSGPILALDSSQATLNKRLASVACLDDDQNPAVAEKASAPTDFRFLFGVNAAENAGAGLHTTAADLDAATLSTTVIDGNRSAAAASAALTPERVAPAVLEDGEGQWIRTDITRGADLIDGQAWIAELKRRLAAFDTGAPVARDVSSQPRTLRTAAPSISLAARARVLREMVATAPPGKKAKLSTGQEVIFWFNVGPPGPPRSRVFVTEAKCPHQGVCLLKSELMEVEDDAGLTRAMARCPRHNKSFDLRTGQSPGNVERLKTYPCRFEHGHWYVGLGLDDEVLPAETARGVAKTLTEQDDKARGAPDIAAVVAALHVNGVDCASCPSSCVSAEAAANSDAATSLGGGVSGQANKRRRAGSISGRGGGSDDDASGDKKLGPKASFNSVPARVAHCPAAIVADW